MPLVFSIQLFISLSARFVQYFVQYYDIIKLSFNVKKVPKEIKSYNSLGGTIVVRIDIDRACI